MVRSTQAAAAAYRDDFSDIKRRVAAVRLQDDLATVMRRPIDVRKSPSGDWVFAHKIDVLWGKLMTGRWQGRLKSLSHLRIMSGEGCTIQIRR